MPFVAGDNEIHLRGQGTLKDHFVERVRRRGGRFFDREDQFCSDRQFFYPVYRFPVLVTGSQFVEHITIFGQ